MTQKPPILLWRRYYGNDLEKYVILILLNLDGKCKWTHRLDENGGDSGHDWMDGQKAPVEVTIHQSAYAPFIPT